MILDDSSQLSHLEKHMLAIYHYEFDEESAIRRGEELYPDGFVLQEDRAQPFLSAGQMGTQTFECGSTRWYIVPEHGSHPSRPRR